MRDLVANGQARSPEVVRVHAAFQSTVEMRDYFKAAFRGEIPRSNPIVPARKIAGGKVLWIVKEQDGDVSLVFEEKKDGIFFVKGICELVGVNE